MRKFNYEWDINKKVAAIWIPDGNRDTDLEVLLKIFQQSRRELSGVSIVFLLMGIIILFWHVLHEVGF